MENKHRKLFVTRQSIKCRLVPKMHQNTFGASPSRNGSLHLSGGRRGKVQRGKEGRGRGKEG